MISNSRASALAFVSAVTGRCTNGMRACSASGASVTWLETIAGTSIIKLPVRLR